MNNISDQQLRQYVDNVFTKYDKDGNYTLDQQEMYQFFKDLFASMNFKHPVTMEDVRHSLKQIDANHDGKVTKRELYNALKMILGVNKQGNNKKQPNLPYQQPKHNKQQEPPRQVKNQQQLQQQQAKQHKYEQEKKRQQQQQHQKPNSAQQAYDYNAQKNQHHQQQQQQQQKKPVVQAQKPVKVPNQMMMMPGMDMMGPFGGMGPGGMGMMDPTMGMYGGMGPPPPGMGMGMGGGMNPFGFW